MLDREVTCRAHTTQVSQCEQQGIRGLVGHVGALRGGEGHDPLRDDDIHDRIGWISAHHEPGAEVPRHAVCGPHDERVTVVVGDREIRLAIEIDRAWSAAEPCGIA